YTWLIVLSFSTPPDTSIRRGLLRLLSLIPNHSRGSSELKPSVVQTRLPPGVFPGAPYGLPFALSTPRRFSDPPKRDGISVLSTHDRYPIPVRQDALRIDRKSVV